MSPVKALRGARGHTALIVTWAVLIAVGLVGGGFVMVSTLSDTGDDASASLAQTDINCVRIHRIVGVGAEIIAAGRTSTEQYYRDGLLTRAQRDRALVQIESQLRRWNSADCR